ncbi:unnamed protein product [Spirodela intermedia]|uniref:Uncharacterized protein n=1 Tax=Spirodela intermedia TaxID=51605 RepID=A0A7I8IVW9_SPIIN|nr:unnamed protein product [Spirodela intermedia]CAA6661920.1 unnamed protein product [Spirodela intermedia]
MSLPSLARPLDCAFRFPDRLFSSHLVAFINPNSRVRSAGPEEPGNAASNEETEVEGLFSFRPWDVPWDWKVTALVMTPYLMRNRNSTVGVKDAEMLKTMAKLSVLYLFVSRYQPFPDDVFSFRWNQPFNLRRGWLLWAGGGLFIASCTAFLAKAIVSGSFDSQTQSELLCFLYHITKWMISTFQRSEFSSGRISGAIIASYWFIERQVFFRSIPDPGGSRWARNCVGMVYAQTRNLLTPISMHAMWNLGVILSLTVLQMMGHDIQVYLMI